MKNNFLSILLLFSLSVFAQHKTKMPEIGIVVDFHQDSLAQTSGYAVIVESVVKCFSPRTVTDQQFKENLQAFQKLRIPLYAVNVFIPGDLKLVGPEVHEGHILDHVEKVLQRCSQAGVEHVVFGSGGARQIPDGFDRATARKQFVSISRKIADVAKKYSITVVLENLNSTETNFITTAAEALSIVKEVNHPNFRLCVDLYHMLKENEPASVIEQTKKYIAHCDIAEKENRTPPGTKGDDFRPYLAALKKIGYHGKIILECRWDNLALQAQPAREALQKQIADVYDQK